MSNTEFETISDEQLATASGGSQLSDAMAQARSMGLRVTSTTGGRHAPRSYHYQGRAFDAAGTHAQMSALYRALQGTNPTELFYDPMGGIKNGRQIGAIGGHRDHIHVAY